MERLKVALFGAAVLGMLAGGQTGSTSAAESRHQPANPRVTTELITDQLQKPVFVTQPPDGSGRLFVVEKEGRVLIVADGAVRPRPFLDITPLVASRGYEQGLLSVAFHPHFRDNRRFYVAYTDRVGNVVIEQYLVAPEDSDVADATSAVTVLYVDKPLNRDRADIRHNGGRLVFGPDGYLYIGVGDGGHPDDPTDNAQSRASLLGKILRIDVDGGSPYGVPPDNPFQSEPDARPEVWAYGLRNPWSFTFDRMTGDLYIADVGENAWEEINFQPAASGGGENYGWNRMEGGHCSRAHPECDPAGFTPPVAEYTHRGMGCAVIGGNVYRGSNLPWLDGQYLFGDYCSGLIWMLEQQPSGEWQRRQLLNTSLWISSFGEDAAGDLYLTSVRPPGLYRLAAAP